MTAGYLVEGPEPVLVETGSQSSAPAVLESLARHGVAAGDLAGVGVRLPDVGVLRPSTPPPDFDLDQALASLHRFRDRTPSAVALAHYGLLPDHMELLEEAQGILRRWAEVAEAAWREGRDIVAALDLAFGGELAAADPAQRDKFETLNGIHSNAAGFHRWLETRAGPSDQHGHA